MKVKHCLKYFTANFTAIAIALSLQSLTKAQTKTDASFSNLRGRLSSEWENVVLTRSLESSTQINNLEFSPDGQLLASVGASQITIWDVDNGEIQRVLTGHSASEIELEMAPTAIAFSPDSSFIATSTWSQGLLTPDQAIVVRDVATGEEVLSITEESGCRQILFDNSGDILYGACDSGITAWSFPDGEKLFSFNNENAVEAIALSPDGKVIATVDANIPREHKNLARQETNHQIRLWQLDDSEPRFIRALDGHANEIIQLKFTADGKRLVSSSYDGKINVWHWRRGTIQRNTSNLYSRGGIFSLSANSQLIAGNFHSSTITNLVTGLPLRNTLKLQQKQKASLMAFNPQNQIFAKVKNQTDGNSLINLWSTANSQPEKVSTKNNYRTIPVSKYWINQEQPSESKINKPSSIGEDPQAITLSALGLTEIIKSEEQVEVKYSQDNLATVTVTQTNLPDDSVAGIRYVFSILSIFLLPIINIR